ncbi:MAG: PEP-CTERM sorting domain-containing protein [Verrucomicrobiota bacterium]
MKKFPTILVLVLTALCASSQAALITWDAGGGDGLWSTATNWDTDTLPMAGDTVNISNGDTVDFNSVVSGQNLPNGVTINLMGNSTLTEPSVIRLNSSSINVDAGSGLAGGFWDLNNGSLVFQDGATATMGNWENKGTNNFQFVLGAAGFSTLTPNTFRNDGNNNGLTLAQKMALATYEVDLASYTGGIGIITLIDYTTDATGLDDATFQNATLNILNSGGYTANLQWNDTADSVELNITAAAAIPEPSTVISLGGFGMLGALIFFVRRKKRAGAVAE